MPWKPDGFVSASQRSDAPATEEWQPEGFMPGVAVQDQPPAPDPEDDWSYIINGGSFRDVMPQVARDSYDQFRSQIKEPEEFEASLGQAVLLQSLLPEESPDVLWNMKDAITKAMYGEGKIMTPGQFMTRAIQDEEMIGRYVAAWNSTVNAKNLTTDMTATEDVVNALYETPENIKIGLWSLPKMFTDAAKRRAMLYSGSGVFPDEMLTHQYEAAPVSEEEPQTGMPFEQDRGILPRDVKFPGAIAAEAAGVVTRLPDVASRAAGAQQDRLRQNQDDALLKAGPFTQLMRGLWQSGIPSVAVSISSAVLTGEPTVGLAMFYETTAGQTFESLRKEGLSVPEAGMVSSVSGAAEVAGEMLVFPKFIKGLKQGISVRSALALIAENAGQELVTGFTQGFTETMAVEMKKGTPLREAIAIAYEVAEKEAILGAGVGGLTAGAIDAVSLPTTIYQSAQQRSIQAAEQKRALRFAAAQGALTEEMVTELEQQVAQQEAEAADVTEQTEQTEQAQPAAAVPAEGAAAGQTPAEATPGAEGKAVAKQAWEEDAMSKGQILPEDIPLARHAALVLSRINGLFDFGEAYPNGLSFRPKRRPQTGEGVFNPTTGEVSVALRQKQTKDFGGEWAKKSWPTDRIQETLAHEIAHAYELGHGQRLKVTEAEMLSHVKRIWAEEAEGKAPAGQTPAEATAGQQGTAEPWEMTQSEWVGAGYVKETPVGNVVVRQTRSESFTGDNPRQEAMNWAASRGLKPGQFAINITKNHTTGEITSAWIELNSEGRDARSQATTSPYARHRDQVKRAVSESKPVPRAVLEEYAGEDWADAALAKMEGGTKQTPVEPKAGAEKATAPTTPVAAEEPPRKVSRAAQRVEEEAIAKDLTKSLGELPTYETMSMEEQARMAAAEMDKDYENAKRMAYGQVAPPAGMRPASIYRAVAVRARNEGDVDTLRNLAVVHPQISEELTAMGQSIKAADVGIQADPVRAMRDVAKTREKAVAKRRKVKNMGAKKKSMAKKAKAEMRKASTRRQGWSEFVNSIRC